MRNVKRYSNQTFTKRVDHVHNASRTIHPRHDPSVCRECGAVYEKGRWFSAQMISDNQAKPTTVCPACRQIEANDVGGFVTIAGTFLAEHRNEIEHLIRNEEGKALSENPLCRIIRWTDTGTEIQIETTSEHLAQRFGRALASAYSGYVKFTFSHENKVARVVWHRDAAA